MTLVGHQPAVTGVLLLVQSIGLTALEGILLLQSDMYPFYFVVATSVVGTSLSITLHRRKHLSLIFT